MPKIKITSQADVDAIPFASDGKQEIWWSTELDHFGVRVSSQSKTFIVGHRVGKLWKRVVIGRSGKITVQAAIKNAKIILGEMVSGVDHIGRRRAETAGGMTLGQAWQLYQDVMAKLNRSPATLKDYQAKINAHLSDWLDRPLVEITREACLRRHTKIGEQNGPYMANGVMRVLRAIWRRVRRQHPELPEAPTLNVDFYNEAPRTAVITDWPGWRAGVQKIGNPVRRDLYLWLAFSGCRAGESMRIEARHVDLDNRLVQFPVTKTDAFAIPLSGFMVTLLRDRIAANGAGCRWVFPSVTAASGHVEEEKLTRSEAKLFTEKWSPHTLRHSWITMADQKVKISDSHARALVNHKPRRAKSSDAHTGYIHLDIDDLRNSQQALTDYLLAQISPQTGNTVVNLRPRKA